MPKDNIQETA